MGVLQGKFYFHDYHAHQHLHFFPLVMTLVVCHVCVFISKHSLFFKPDKMYDFFDNNKVTLCTEGVDPDQLTYSDAN